MQDDSSLALACARVDSHGSDRRREEDRGKPLASSSTLNRLEVAVPRDDSEEPCLDRYRCIACDPPSGQHFFTDLFAHTPAKPPKEIILDGDATDSSVHGNQEGRFFHGYYGNYCSLPLSIFRGDHLLWAERRQANADGAAGTVEAVQSIVKTLRRQ